MIATGQSLGFGNSKSGAVGVKDSIGKTSEPKLHEATIMPIAAADMTAKRDPA
jgi:hypothetical protein